MCIYIHVYYFCHFPYFNNWTSPLNVLFAWFGLVWFLMSDSLFIINLIDCFFFLSLNTCLKSPQSCGHGLANMPLPTSNAFLIAAEWPWINSFTSTWTTFANSLCVTRRTSVFNLHNHPVPTSCHFMTAKSEESAAVHINDPSTRLAFQERPSWFLFLSIAFLPKPHSTLCPCLHSQNPARIESSLLCSYSTDNGGAS